MAMSSTKKLVRKVGYELADMIRRRERIDLIENTFSDRLSTVEDLSVFISGCNRSGIPGQNKIIRGSERGRYIIVLNPIDGHVNYFRGCKVFAANVCLHDRKSQERYSVVYDGLSDEVFEFGGETYGEYETEDVDVSPRPVLGLGHVRALEADMTQKIDRFSLRSIGSTTVSILGVLRGHIDMFINRTKLWNIYWSFGLCQQSMLNLDDWNKQRPLLGCEDELLVDPAKTIHFVCYRKNEVKNSILSSLTGGTS